MTDPRFRIALVEDNADNRLLLDAILGDRYALVEYATGPEALVGLRADPPDLVLLDVSLPGMDGPEVLSHLRRVPAFDDVPVLALTAHAMAGDRARLLAAGFDDYLSKPIMDEDALLATIARWLATRRSANPGAA